MVHNARARTRYRAEAERSRARNNVKEGRSEFLLDAPERHAREESGKGDEDGRTATEGVALMGRERSPSRCRASCCNAKLKQNYLVPLSYGTRHGDRVCGGEGGCVATRAP